MCGICGILERDPARPVDEARLRGMTEALHHRGPDDQDVHVDGGLGLGHRRLSIIDLSDAGRQPMSTPDGRLWIVLNGEIYNYRELRVELEAAGCRFRSQTDTEVLLHLFDREGPEGLRKLIGMFAFAIWDARARRLFAARDHFGVKPFYYAATGDRFVFASEIKALVGPGGVPAELNQAGLADYVTFQFTLDDKTLFKGVRKLMPGHYLVVEPGGDPVVRKYWDVSFEVDTHHTEAYFQQRLRELLDDSIRLQLRADVPIGAHLSGGLDSTTVTCLAAGTGARPFHTFSGGFADGPAFDETRYARIAAAEAGTVHHEVFPTAADFVEQMPRLAYAMDEPAAGPGLFPQYAVSKLAAQHVKVVLGGQGGDEIFGGYTRYLVAYLEACIKGGIEGSQEDHRYIVTFESILPNLAQLRGYEPMLRQFMAEGLFDSQEHRYFRLVDRSADMLGALDGAAWEQMTQGYRPFEAFQAVFDAPECHSLINKMTRFDLKTLLPALLQVEDRTSMSVSLESRVPLLDHRIVELVASMPPMVKFKGGRSKHVFREVVAGIVPDEIYKRTDKMGFPVPLNRWYREEPVRGFVRDVLLGRAARERGLVRPDRVEAMLDSERDYGRGLWGLLNVELWAQTFLDAHR
ncbi:MAG: asparagine synthase (glutamine-hydrolyzing) [Vicinamibacterales bacterium]|nr:asparagine synthase (glutamine-hydrolyzing) [Vicinamibacterales bacterium]